MSSKALLDSEGLPVGLCPPHKWKKNERGRHDCIDCSKSWEEVYGEDE